MPLNNPNGGFSYSPEYQSSALPWVTSSVATAQPQEWDFPYITRFVTVINNDSSGSLSIALTYSGSIGSNRVVIPPVTAVNFEWRVAKVFIKAESAAGPNYSLAVGLTTIPGGQMPVLSASFPDGTSWQGVG